MKYAFKFTNIRVIARINCMLILCQMSKCYHYVACQITRLQNIKAQIYNHILIGDCVVKKGSSAFDTKRRYTPYNLAEKSFYKIKIEQS